MQRLTSEEAVTAFHTGDFSSQIKKNANSMSSSFQEGQEEAGPSGPSNIFVAGDIRVSSCDEGSGAAQQPTQQLRKVSKNEAPTRGNRVLQRLSSEQALQEFLNEGQHSRQRF